MCARAHSGDHQFSLPIIDSPAKSSRMEVFFPPLSPSGGRRNGRNDRPRELLPPRRLLPAFFPRIMIFAISPIFLGENRHARSVGYFPCSRTYILSNAVQGGISLKEPTFFIGYSFINRSDSHVRRAWPLFNGRKSFRIKIIIKEHKVRIK